MAYISPQDRAYLDLWYDSPAPPPPPADVCCIDFRRGVFAASIHDPTCCTRCARVKAAEAAAKRYAWRPTIFGHIRIVPASEAQRWQEETELWT